MEFWTFLSAVGLIPLSVDVIFFVSSQCVHNFIVFVGYQP